MTAEEDFKIERNLRYRSVQGKAQVALILQNPYVGPELPLGAHYTITATLFEHIVESSDDKLPTEPILLIEMDTELASQCSNLVQILKDIRSENNDKLFTPIHLGLAIDRLELWREKPTRRIDVVGLNGELELLLALIDWAGKSEQKILWALRLWAGNKLGITFDFMGRTIIFESKATQRNEDRIHTFSSSAQANIPLGKVGYLASIGLKMVQAPSLAGASLIDRLERVRGLLKRKLSAKAQSAEIMQKFEEIVSSLDLSNLEGANDNYSINPNLPLLAFPYSSIHGIEAIRQFYVKDGWHSCPEFVLNEGDGFTIAEVLETVSEWESDGEEE